MSKQAKIILFCCLYILGIISLFSTVLLAFCFLFLANLSFVQLKRNIFSHKYLIALFIIFFIGLTNTSIHLKQDDDLTTYADNQVIVNAKVLTIPSNNIKDRTKFFAQVSSISLDDINEKNINAKTMVTINDSQANLNKIKIGDTLKLTGKLKEPISATNPSQFDYAKYLQFKNTFSLLYVNDKWEITSNAKDLKGKLLRRLNDKRNEILSFHKQNIKSPMIEILGGIIFGDDAVNPDEETKEDFINSGIFHILAASGMNVTLIFGIWFFFAKSLRLNYRFSIITGILLILVYTCMTGFGPPIIRAFLMLTLILIGKLLDKTTSTLSLLFIVGFFMLVYNPLMVFDIGFQLSFIVTFALILSAPLLTFDFKFKPFNYILGACLIPIIAQLYAAPLQMFYFNTFALYSVFANIAIVPVLSIISFIGFVSSILALVPILSTKICFVADMIINPFLVYIVKVANFFANLPNAIVYLKKPSLFQIILYFSIIIGITLLLLNKEKRKQIAYPIVALILLFAFSIIPQIQNNTEILFFSVGNADACLIKSPSNKYFIIDTGKIPYGKGNSQANYIIIKYLKDKGVKTIDGLVLSHFDSDHAGGTIDILKNLKVKNIYLSDTYEDTILSSSITKYLQEKNMQTTIVKEKEITINDNKNFSLRLFKPTGNEIKTENEKSIVALLNDNNNKVLFMGDGNIKSYRELPNDFKTNIKVMKSGHHGAIETINEEIIKNTETFIISTGTNVYNHPHSKTIELLENNNKRYFRTDYYNAIKIIFKNNIAQIYAYSPKMNKFIKI